MGIFSNSIQRLGNLGTLHITGVVVAAKEEGYNPTDAMVSDNTLLHFLQSMTARTPHCTYMTFGNRYAIPSGELRASQVPHIVHFHNISNIISISIERRRRHVLSRRRRR